MTPDDHARYVRWQDHRITQLSFAANLFLGFAVASLAYAINLKLENLLLTPCWIAVFRYSVVGRLNGVQ